MRTSLTSLFSSHSDINDDTLRSIDVENFFFIHYEIVSLLLLSLVFECVLDLSEKKKRVLDM